MRFGSEESGFTLLEVLMALVVFALISAICYAALGPAGEGFKQLQQSRDELETSAWLGKQLRLDIAAATGSSLKLLQPIELHSDMRGNTHADRFSLLVREMGRKGITRVYYHLDEEKGLLLRESRMAWARDSTASDRMTFDNVSSFQVEVMDQQGQWQAQVLKTDMASVFVWPRAVRVTVIQNKRQMQWLLPLYLGLQRH